ncbi:MAG: LPS assembly protein LptD [Gammaproteobacteria bacterium]|nr:LPS assembly protein LptD [Gammaproteobacteria bacterium]
MERLLTIFLIAALCLFPCASPFLLAETLDPRWALCGPDTDIAPRPSVLPLEGDAEDAAYVTADEAEAVVRGGPWNFWGDVEVSRGAQQLRADSLIYDQQNETVKVTGDVKYWDEQVTLSAQHGHVELDQDTAEFEGVTYRLLDRHGRGQAVDVFLDQDAQIAKFEDVDYTTCLPEDNDWKLSVKKLKLDLNAEWGTARDVILKVKDIPVFYSPYVSFPISNKRKTGFLVPSFGNTNNSGFEVRTPFYWNIAPEMDATLTPRPMSRRGLMLMGEYRYLFRRGDGQLDGQFLPSDNEFDNKNRYLIAFTHDQTFLDRGKLFLTYNKVSDDSYFSDFGNSLSLSSQRFLDRRADVSYEGDRWNALGRVQDFQTIDPTIPIEDRPYQRLPQLLFNAQTANRNKALNLNFAGEAVNFDREQSVTGGRFDFYPMLSYPMRTVGTFLVPKASLRFTQYALDRNLTFGDTPDRLIPYASLDSGVYLERDLTMQGRMFLQTLEPRLYYLYVPFQNQNDLPIFDTSNNDFSFEQLFRQDSFTGADRVENANQLALAVTTRFLHGASGEETARLSLGQLFFFRDRLVQVPGVPVQTDPVSPFVADLVTQLPWDMRARGSLQWNPNNNVFDQGAFHLSYDPAGSRIINVAYRLRRSVDVEQTDVSAVWPVGVHWNVVGRWLYSLQDTRTLEVFGGVEYNSCCWGLRAIFRRFVNDVAGDNQIGFFIEIELKGLAGLGRQTTTFLRESIPGYENEF